MEMRRHNLYSSSTNMPCKNNYLHASRTLYIVVYSKMPERRPPRVPQNNPPQNYKPQQTRRVRNINQEKTERYQTDDSVDAEAVLCIKELHEGWAYINIIRPTQFPAQKNDVINKKNQRRVLGWDKNTVTQTTVARRHWIPTLLHKPGGSRTTP